MSTNKKPRNFVTDSQDALRAAAFKESMDLSGAPEVTKDLVEWLEACYPPVCYDPRRESLEAHILYAGTVELVRVLRNLHEHQMDAFDPGVVSVDIQTDDGDMG